MTSRCGAMSSRCLRHRPWRSLTRSGGQTATETLPRPGTHWRSLQPSQKGALSQPRSRHRRHSSSIRPSPLLSPIPAPLVPTGGPAADRAIGTTGSSEGEAYHRLTGPTAETRKAWEIPGFLPRLTTPFPHPIERETRSRGIVIVRVNRGGPSSRPTSAVPSLRGPGDWVVARPRCRVRR